MEAQKPSIGRIVHYRDEQGTTCAAIITTVWTDTCVNLTVFPNGAPPVCRSSMLLGDGHGQWSWPPRI